MKLCKVEECEQQHWGRGYCNYHFNKLYYKPKNLERIKAYQRWYQRDVNYVRNREKICKRYREKRRKNPEKVRAYYREYYRRFHVVVPRKKRTIEDKRRYHREYYHRVLKHKNKGVFLRIKNKVKSWT